MKKVKILNIAVCAIDFGDGYKNEKQRKLHRIAIQGAQASGGYSPQGLAMIYDTGHIAILCLHKM
jgi:hypothetical protein